MNPASPLVFWGFTLLLALVLAATVYILKRYAELSPLITVLSLALWMGVTGTLAAVGIFSNWDLRPPPLLLLFATMFTLIFVLSRRAWFFRLLCQSPLWLLIAFASYRLPLELIMHQAALEKVMPVQMSYSGYNFDILTGILAIIVGFWAYKGEAPKVALWFFNIVGISLLATIIGIATLSTPIMAFYGPDQLNVWVAYVPYVWLPTIFVAFAILGHIALTRRLLRT